MPHSLAKRTMCLNTPKHNGKFGTANRNIHNVGVPFTANRNIHHVNVSFTAIILFSLDNITRKL